MLNNNFNNLFNRRNNNPQDGEFEDIISSILQQFSAETITECRTVASSNLILPNESGEILLEEFIDQLLIALRTIFNISKWG